MSEYFHVERPFLDQLGALGWTVIDTESFRLIQRRTVPRWMYSGSAFAHLVSPISRWVLDVFSENQFYR